jgi:hypothetical protein
LEEVSKIIKIRALAEPWWLSLAAAIAFAFAIYLAIERPFTQLGRLLAARAVVSVRVV